MLAAAFCVLAAKLSGQSINVVTEIKVGIIAYNQAKYGEAILHLERVVAADPQSATAHFYLGEAYDRMYSRECRSNCIANERRRQRAMEEFHRALALDPSLTGAMKAIAWSNQGSANFDEADHYYRKALSVDPNDTEALYNLAVLGWTRSYQLRQVKKANLRLGEKSPLIHSRSCHEVRRENLARVEESIAMLERCGSIFENRDAQLYLNLLYRERAEIQCDNQSAYDEDSATAQKWARRACRMRGRDSSVAIRPISSERLQPSLLPAPAGDLGACKLN